MQYTIARDHYVQEFDIELYQGGTVDDGDLEPDVIAQLVSSGVLASDTPRFIEVDEKTLDDDGDEQPPSRRRGRPSNG